MKNYENVLFINYGGIGDEILFLPTISAFKHKYPNAKISLALEKRSKAIKDLTDLIDEIITVDIKANGLKKYVNVLKFIISNWFKNFDCVISSGKSPLVAIILFLSGIKERVGYKSKLNFLLTNSIELNENQYAGKMYHDLLKPLAIEEYENPKIIPNKEFEIKNFIAIHPGVSKMSISKNILKCPDFDFWNQLIIGLLNKGKKVLLLGTNDDKELIDKILKNEVIKNNSNFINYFNKTKNIMEMASIMKASDSVICVDSAPLHVAVAVGAKVYAIFAPTNEEKLVPKNDNIKIITNENCKCRPCLWHKRSVNCDSSECLQINPNMILDKIN